MALWWFSLIFPLIGLLGLYILLKPPSVHPSRKEAVQKKIYSSLELEAPSSIGEQQKPPIL